MITFEITHQSTKSAARAGLLHTPHGTVETPTLVPVATQAVIKTLTQDQVRSTNTQMVISNTFHLHLKPGEDIVQKTGGIHAFGNWNCPIMTDSGGFQVFSLGFGRDLGVGKVLSPGKTASAISKGTQPSSVQITKEGAHFRSPIDGRKIFIGPKESIAIQEKLGADIIYAFDECTPPFATKEYIASSCKQTHEWAKICRDVHTSDQALYGIIQGSNFQDLREESAQAINSIGFDGFGIGGDLGENKEDTKRILSWIIPHIDASKPRHLLGIGHIEDLEPIITHGVDTFDCTIPTHYARHGTAFTSEGRVTIKNSAYIQDFSPLDPTCSCIACTQHHKSYLCHLIRSKEITGLVLLTIHNLTFFHDRVAALRKRIIQNEI